MDERKVILADGTEVPNCSVAQESGTLWVYPDDMTMKEAAEIFFDEEKTARITYVRDEASSTYEGYTVPNLLNAVPGGVRLQLMRGE